MNSRADDGADPNETLSSLESNVSASGRCRVTAREHLGFELNSAHNPSPARAHRPCRADQRLAALNGELSRLAKLPPTSQYAVHRIAICKKALELLQKPRGAAEADELEKLLASLSL